MKDFSAAEPIPAVHHLARSVVHSVRPYVLAVLSVAAVLGLLLWAHPEVEMTVPLSFLIAVMLGAWYGGFGPGLLATFLSTLMIHAFYLQDRPRDREAVELVEFVLAGLMTTTLTWQLQRSLQLARNEHARYLDLVEELEAIVWEARPGEHGLEFTYVNRRLTDLLGIRPDQWLADSTLFTRYLSPDDLTRLLRMCTQGGAEEFEMTLPAADGHPLTFRTQIRASRNHGCTLRGIMLDVTERQRFTAALEESERRFRLLAENAHDMIFRYRLEPKRGFEYVSPASRTILGYAPEEHYADPDLIFRIVHPDDRPGFESIFGSGVEPSEPALLRWKHKDGSWVWTESYVRFVRDERGRVIAHEGISRDITDRKRTEELQSLSIEVAAAANEATDLLSASKRCMEIISRVEGWNAAIAWFPSDDESYLSCAAQFSAEPRTTPFLEDCKGKRFEKGVGLVGQAWAARTPLWIPDLASYEPFQRKESAKRAGLTSGLGFPIQFGRTLDGVFEFFSFSRRESDPIALEAFDRLGIHLGIIFERKQAEERRSELLARERKAREEAEAAQRRTAFLAEASALLEASLDFNRTLSNVARLAAARLADWCSIFMVRDDGSLERVAVVHSDPAQVELADRLQARYPTRPNEPVGIYHVLRTGRPEIYPDIPDETLRSVARDEEHLKILRDLGLVSAMIVPLRIRQTTLGVISLASTTPNRHYGQADLETAEALALRAAQAIQNSRLYREAQEAVRAREEFLSIAAHELKTPLTTLQLQMQSLLRLARKGECKIESIETALRQGDRLGALIGNLLDVSRITAGRLQLDREKMDLSIAVRNVVERLRENFRRSGSAVTVRADAAANGSWDRLRLEQVIVNLLSNAIKYGHGKPIEVTVESDESKARLIVKDQGIGIPPEAMGRLFAPFERAVSSRHYSGLGLGLYIVHQIVEAHGGSIRVESQPGAGSTFTIEIPRAPAEGKTNVD